MPGVAHNLVTTCSKYLHHCRHIERILYAAGPWNDERNFTNLGGIEERESDEGAGEPLPAASPALGKVDREPKHSVLAIGSERSEVCARAQRRGATLGGFSILTGHGRARLVCMQPRLAWH